MSFFDTPLALFMAFDLCTASPNPCGKNAACKNEIGIAKFSCPTGYLGDQNVKCDSNQLNILVSFTFSGII